MPITHISLVVVRGKQRVDIIRCRIIACVAIADANFLFPLGDIAVMYQMSVVSGQVILEQENDRGGFVQVWVFSAVRCALLDVYRVFTSGQGADCCFHVNSGSHGA